MLGYTIFLITFVLLPRVAWLGYCAWISHTEPKRAADIIEASGRWFPFRIVRWPWGKS